MKINIFWFRRDLRLEDNSPLEQALASGLPVLPLFIFDTNITGELPRDDARISFIYKTLSGINNNLEKAGSSLCVIKGDPLVKWQELISEFDINAVFIGKDYEPYAIKRDNEIKELLGRNSISLFRFRDQVIFEENEILKPDNKPYTIFTPYMKRWMKKLDENPFRLTPGKSGLKSNFYQHKFQFPSLQKTGFRESSIKVKPYDLSVIPGYHNYRNLPAIDRTSYLSPHLRFGTVSIRYIASLALKQNMSFLNELIWREFFMQILFHFPAVVTDNFRPLYDNIEWRNDESEFLRWCNGETGYPMVDAGMRQLNETGYMHNRVRMITAGFLCKHLLIDWRWGEAYFAQKLLDYELSSNNGNWQWAAGTGCDAVPYFRVFNPETQQKKFDPGKEYIKKWIHNYIRPDYPEKMIDHEFARRRALTVYNSGINRNF
ncbi:MAG TPA: deoxyribodipyrimidine photolyase [Bacteroidales bacterium]|jgi:deoxyribodipyrimidine photo-lyase|nr:deoxyribodipyrimidine photolyase [Bacteroidales bacterium]